jgi:nucleotide-binding universal stress UspA family protein
MKYKNILVHLDNSSGCRNRLEVAFGLAKEYEAELLGLFVVPTYIMPSYVEAQISVDLINEVTEKALERARDTARRYEKLAQDAGVKLQTAVIEGQAIPVLREHSKYADLLLLGQDHPDDPDNASYGLADALLFEGACACLVVPHSGKVSAPAKRVLLTWNASRESARALREAMPLLRGAETVVVLSSEPDGGDDQLATGHPHAEALQKLLESHGIESVSSGFNDLELSASEAIIGQSAEMDADLIVMGAYGHARLREIILGGVTRELLKRAPTCLLLAH